MTSATPRPTTNFRVWDDGDTWTFDLDLPNGRWQAATSVANTATSTAMAMYDAADYVCVAKDNGNVAKYTEWRDNFGVTPPPPPPRGFSPR